MGKRAIVHLEIPSSDREVTASFYADLFGWDYDHIDDPMPYTTWTGENIGGGYTEVGEHYNAGEVLVYVASEDIDADLEKAESLGGKVLIPRREIPGVGWMGAFADPTGNRIALFTGLG